MGIFKNMRDLADVTKKAKAMGDAEMERTGMKKGLFGAPSMSDSLSRMNTALDQVREMQEKSALLQTGVPGKGVVAGLTDTGMEVNMNRVVEIAMDVSADGAETYRTTVREGVSPMMMPQIQLGNTVPVRIDPEDRDRVTLDWARYGQG